MITITIMVAIIALALGATVSYDAFKPSIITATQTVTATSSVIVIQPAVTTVTMKSDPNTVVLSGWVETESFEPVEVAFRVCYYGNLSGILGSAFCGNKNYSSPVSNIRSWNVSSDLAGGAWATNYNGIYSVQVPNNSTYDVYLVITDPNETPIAYEKVDVVRLPVYSDTQNISNYDLGCEYEGAGNSFYYCIAA